MEWHEVLTMNTDMLGVLIEDHCYGRRWRYGIDTAAQHLSTGQWLCSGAYTPGQRPPNYLGSWEKCMALLWRYEIGLYPPEDGLPYWLLLGVDDTRIEATTEAEARIGICRLALYAATHAKEDADVPSTR